MEHNENYTIDQQIERSRSHNEIVTIDWNANMIDAAIYYIYNMYEGVDHVKNGEITEVWGDDFMVHFRSVEGLAGK